MQETRKCCVRWSRGTRQATGVSPANADIAEMLKEMAALLERQGASPFRVAAYRRGALSVRAAREPLAALFDREGREGIERLPAIGNSLAKKIVEMLRRGSVRALERLQRRAADDDLLTTLPTVGPLLAERIRHSLDVHSLEELYAAACDGRLRRTVGFGQKRLQAIRDSLARRLDARARQLASRAADSHRWPTCWRSTRRIACAARGQLPRIAPKRFNPSRTAWLSVLRSERGGATIARASPTRRGATNWDERPIGSSSCAWTKPRSANGRSSPPPAAHFGRGASCAGASGSAWNITARNNSCNFRCPRPMRIRTA